MRCSLTLSHYSVRPGRYLILGGSCVKVARMRIHPACGSVLCKKRTQKQLQFDTGSTNDEQSQQFWCSEHDSIHPTALRQSFASQSRQFLRSIFVRMHHIGARKAWKNVKHDTLLCLKRAYRPNCNWHGACIASRVYDHQGLEARPT